MEKFLIPLLVLASISDWKFRKIPNFLTLPAAATALFIHSAAQGWDGFFFSLGGFMTGLLLLLIPFLLGGTGAGDVKLLAMVGAFTGTSGVFKVMLAAAVLGGLYSIVEAVRRKAARQLWQGICQRLLYVAFSRRLFHESEIRFTDEPVTIPYALAISAGYFCVLLSGGV